MSLSKICGLKIPKYNPCCFCEQSFSIRGYSQLNELYPYILSCGHLSCERCIRSKAMSTMIICRVCQGQTFLQLNANLTDHLSQNMYLLGRLTAAGTSDSRANMVPPIKTIIRKTPNQSKLTECKECNRMTAVNRCGTCDVDLCSDCWRKVHPPHIKTLSEHVKLPLSLQTGLNIMLTCSSHSGQYCDLFCTMCDVSVCRLCLNDVIHRNHSWILMEKWNENYLPSLDKALHPAQEVLLRMEDTLEKVKAEKRNIQTGGKGCDLEREISVKFMILYGLLQLEEERLMKEAAQVNSMTEKSLDLIATNLENKIQLIRQLVDEGQMKLLSGKVVAGNLQSLIQKLEEVVHEPHHLISPYNNSIKTIQQIDPFSVINIFNGIHITPSHSSSYQLKSTNELPLGYVMPPLERPLHTDLHLGEYASSRASLDGRLSRSSSAASVSSLGRVLFTDIKINETYRVEMRHLNNPSEFYVLLQSNFTTWTRVRNKCNEYGAFPMIPLNTVSEGEWYLLSCKQSYNRVTIIETLENIIDEKIRSAMVKHLDFGYIETVPITRLRNLPDGLRQIEPLVRKCSLSNCSPQGEFWNRDCINFLKTKTKSDDAAIYMKVLGLRDDCLEVDLSIQRENDRIESLCRLMGSFGFSNAYSPRNTTRLRNPVVTYPSNNLNIGDRFEAVVSFICNPGRFYVQKQGDEMNYLDSMMGEIQNFYHNSRTNRISKPFFGQPVAAKFTDNVWYRGLIKEVGNNQVKVEYIDYGNFEVLPVGSVRALDGTFCDLPPQAIRCKLAEIVPCDNGTWNPAAKIKFDEYVNDKTLTVRIQGKDRNFYNVYLIDETIKHKTVFINNKFVEDGLARFTGSTTKTDITNKSKKCLQNQKPISHISPFMASIQNTQNRDKTKKPNQNKTKHRVEVVNNESEEVEIEDEEKEEEEENKEDEDVPVFKRRVGLLHYESPSSFYLYFKNNQYIKLERNLQIEMKNSKPDETSDWAVGDLYAVFSEDQKLWLRGKIIEKTETKVKVFLIDYGVSEWIPLDNLRALPGEFVAFRVRALYCSLDGILPCGNGTQWTLTASEHLQSLFDKFENDIKMTFQLEDANKSPMPVKLWIQEDIKIGPLEPIRESWISMDQLMIARGVAFPSENFKRVKLDEDFNPIIKEEQQDENAECVNKNTTNESYILGTITDWLPPVFKKGKLHQVIPTCVELLDNGILTITFHYEEDTDQLKEISDGLTDMYFNKAPQPYDQFWSMEQICIVNYLEDSKWYRGKVICLNDDETYLVEFVDYGNKETVTPCQLRQTIKFEEIPILSHKCQLAGIKPCDEDGYTNEAAEELLTYINNKVCQLEFIDTSLTPPSVKLTYCHENVNEFLFINRFAHSVPLKSKKKRRKVAQQINDVIVLPAEEHGPNRNEQVKERETESEDVTVLCGDEEPVNLEYPLNKDVHMLFDWFDLTKPPLYQFQPLELREDVSELEVTPYTYQIQDNDVYFTAVPLSGYDLIPQIDAAYKNMEKEIAENKEVLMTNFKQGKPCLAFSEEYDKWFRAEVVEQSSDGIDVLYVDYGNIEHVPPSCVKEIRPYWVSIPTMALKFKLFNVKVNPLTDLEILKNALHECLIDKGELFVKIINRHPAYYEVEVFTESNGPLIYKELLEQLILNST